jgi:branched-chain amino acid transport system permease protein
MLQLLANGLCSGALYAIVALGFGLIYRATGVFHFAYGALCTIAAYLLYLLGVTMGRPPIGACPYRINWSSATSGGRRMSR